MNYPYNDETMEYDYTLHGYVLTKKGVLDFLNTNLDTYLDATGDSDPSTLGEKVLRKISRHVYSWIYAHTPNEDFIERVLATYPPARERIREVLIAEVDYNLQNGTFWNYADNEHGLEKSICEDSKAILERKLPNGLNILYQGRLPFMVPESQYHVGY